MCLYRNGLGPGVGLTAFRTIPNVATIPRATVYVARTTMTAFIIEIQTQKIAIISFDPGM